MPLLLRGDVEHQGLVDHEFERSARYLSPRVDAALYHADVRCWTRAGERIVELLAMGHDPSSPAAPTHLFVVHGALHPGRSSADAQEEIRAATDESLAEFGIRRVGRAFHLAAVVHPPSGLFAAAEVDGIDPQRALTAWQLATMRTDEPSHAELSRLVATQNLSEPTADMTLVVHHDGAALVLCDDVTDVEEPFASWLEGKPADDVASSEVQWHVHTILTDCVLLGLLQRAGLNALADRVADVATRRPDVETMLALEEAFARFKASVWWRHVSEEETGNLVLQAFQNKHRLADLLDNVAQGLTQYSGQVQAMSAALSSAAVTILTVTVFPLTVLIAFITAVVPESASFLIKLVAYFLTIPVTLGVGLLVASWIPHYLPFLRSTLRSSRR